MNIQIYYSSLTGNTKKVASHLADALQEEGHAVQFFNTRTRLEADLLPAADLILICFWCRRSSMDYDSLKLLSLYRDQPIAAVGTIGGDLQGSYGQRVRDKVEQAVSEQNRCKGVFLCQGKIPLAKTEARRKLPKDDPHYLDDEAYARRLAALTHPDEEDLRQALNFVHTVLAPPNFS